MATKRYEPTVQLDNGLIIPASAGAGKVLTSDASGNATWQAPGIDTFDALQAGIVAAGDCALTVNSTSQVTIAAGTVFTPGTPIDRNAVGSTILATIPAAATYTRLDCIACSAAGVVTRIQGAETNGATIANRTGAPAVPATSQLLHDILVTTGGVLAANVRDRRPWARGAFYPITRASGNYTTSSGALGDVDATNLSTRMECSGVPVRLSLKGVFSINAVNTFNGFAITMDGTVVVREDPGSPVSGCQVPVCIEGVVTPAAGSHLFRPQFGTGGSGTLTLMAANAADNQLFFTVEELVRSAGRNGTA